MSELHMYTWPQVSEHNHQPKHPPHNNLTLEHMQPWHINHPVTQKLFPATILAQFYVTKTQYACSLLRGAAMVQPRNPGQIPQPFMSQSSNQLLLQPSGIKSSHKELTDWRNSIFFSASHTALPSILPPPTHPILVCIYSSLSRSFSIIPWQL